MLTVAGNIDYEINSTLNIYVQVSDGENINQKAMIVNVNNVKETPTMGSEDFSYMLKEKPGAYIWLGAGEDAEKLHSPYYDFNDELLPIGAEYWANLAETILLK